MRERLACRHVRNRTPVAVPRLRRQDSVLRFRARGFSQSRPALCKGWRWERAPDFGVCVHLLTALAANPGKVVRSEMWRIAPTPSSRGSPPVLANDKRGIDPRPARLRRRLRTGAAGHRHHFARSLRCGGKRRTRHRAPVAAERIRSGRAPTSFLLCARRQRPRSRLRSRSFRAPQLPISAALCLPGATKPGGQKRNPLDGAACRPTLRNWQRLRY